LSESPIELAGSGSVPVGAAVFAGPSPRPGAGRRRVGALLGTVAGAALLVAGAAGCSSSSGGGSGTLSQPDKIASLKKSPDQSMAKEILKAAKGHTGGGKLTAVVYQDGSDSSKTVMVYGGVGIPLPSGDTDSQFTSMLGSGTEVGGGHGGRLRPADEESVPLRGPPLAVAAYSTRSAARNSACASGSDSAASLPAATRA